VNPWLIVEELAGGLSRKPTIAIATDTPTPSVEERILQPVGLPHSLTTTNSKAATATIAAIPIVFQLVSEKMKAICAKFATMLVA
jgi:hypothetical protein